MEDRKDIVIHLLESFLGVVSWTPWFLDVEN